MIQLAKIKRTSPVGKMAIVTPASGAKILSAAVTVPARDVEKTKKKLQGVRNVELETMDLMDPVSI